MVSEGQTLDGTYHLQRVVGEGGMGVVYEATHARLAGRYAIKVLLPELCGRPEVRARFDREARITSSLQHPNIVQVIDHNSTTDGTSYLVMEYLSGDSLAERLRRAGRLPVAAVADIVAQLAAGLAAAHARGIVHRDLKPDNIYLVPVEGRAGELIKILDFGISKVGWGRDAADRDQEICGTPQYMAPEQVEGRIADVDATTDAFALAVIAHELLTGKSPFAAETFQETFTLVRSGIVPPTGLGAAIDAVLERALRQDNALRFPTVTAFAEAFREAALDPPPDVMPLPPPIPPPPSASDRSPPVSVGSRRRGARLGVAAAVAVAITSLVGTGAADRAPTPARGGLGLATEPAGPSVEPPPVPARETILTAAVVPEIPVSPAVRAPLARPHAAARRTRAGRPQSTVPAASAPSRLSPDEDATLPPSAF